tara:strand:- start:376 stop:696 length:321 start_codon:yes stop_codon:yes gene_type:complete
MTNIIRATKDGVTKDFNSLEDAKKEFPDSEYLVITDQTSKAQAAIRVKATREKEWRDSELVRTDTIVATSDYPNKTNMIEYRKELRDWPSKDYWPTGRPVLKTEQE